MLSSGIAQAAEMAGTNIQEASPAPATQEASQMPPTLPLADDLVEATIEVLPPGVTPQSASGCNLDVCISIVGEDLHVDKVSGTGKSPGQRCVTFDVDANLTTVARSNVACGSFGSIFVGTWPANRNFANKTKLCDAFRGVGGAPGVLGYPCKTVHD
jgi:hypothetical protein